MGGVNEWNWFATQRDIAKCFLFLPNSALTWTEAQTKCTEYGGNLVTFESRDELLFVSAMRLLHYHKSMNKL